MFFRTSIAWYSQCKHTYIYIYLEPKWPLFRQTSLMTFTFLDSTLGKVKLIRACKERCFYSKGLEQIPDFIRESNKRYLCNLRQTYPMSGKRNIIFKHALGEDMLDCQEGILWNYEAPWYIQEPYKGSSPNSLWPGKLVAPKGSGLHVEKKSMAVQNLGNIFVDEIVIKRQTLLKWQLHCVGMTFLKLSWINLWCFLVTIFLETTNLVHGTQKLVVSPKITIFFLAIFLFSNFPWGSLRHRYSSRNWAFYQWTVSWRWFFLLGKGIMSSVVGLYLVR